MEMTGRIVRQISLISMLVLIVPMIMFPDQLGMRLTKFSLINAVYELVYYSAVIFFFYRRASLLKIIQMAGLCLVYRLTLGALFGLLIVVMYSMNLTISLTLGLASYLPAILLHIAATPFILKPVVAQLVPYTKRKHQPIEEPAPAEAPEHGGTATAVSAKQEEPAPAEAPEHGGTATAVSAKQAISRPTPAPVRVPEPEAQFSKASRVGSPSGREHAEANGFDRAARYIGEDGSVQLAVVVDGEGLLLGQFIRGEMKADDWAPFSLLFCEANRDALRRAGWGSPEKIDLLVKDTRIIVAREESWCLMVVAQRHADDFLNIKINQGLEIIRKYIARRYGQKLSVNAEKMYVSST
jgi:hypothetical protein